MKILCAYVRENSNARAPSESGLGPWPEFPSAPKQSDLRERAKWRSERAEALKNWISTLPKLRTDIQTALEVLGSRDEVQFQVERADVRPGQEDGYRLDLRGANLQAAQLAHLDFRMARLDGSRLEGAQLMRARMNQVVLTGAHMERANFSGAQLLWAVFSAGRLEGADFRRAQMAIANFVAAEMQEVNLREVGLVEAPLDDANLEAADLSLAWTGGTSFKRAIWVGTRNNGSVAQFADFRGGKFLDQSRLMSMIGNAATLLPETPEGDAELFVPSCWLTDPPGSESRAAIYANRGLSKKRIRDPANGFFCAPGTVPMKTGTPWPVDRPPPWQQAGMPVEDWLALPENQPVEPVDPDAVPAASE
ncbi:pentapeptide repeat-containing protein [Fluviibacterium sp. S390]|uniref:pentapeptide repeat-containing protein n=1 Tax=Fluviibacterium sp. S390 TaxID=3415139 RepID=UPI003C7AF0D6